MNTQNKALLSLGNVKAFRGVAVIGYGAYMTDDDFVKHLNETFQEVSICNLNVKSGETLQVVAPIWFNRLKVDYLEGLDAALYSQLAQLNDVDIDFHE